MILLNIAWKNIFRHKKRTLLTSMIISIGVVMVVLFGGATVAFKNVMIGEITDSMLGHIQIHKKGYMNAVDTQPLDMVIKPQMQEKIMQELKAIPEIVGIAPRLKFNVMISNYDKSVAMRVTAIEPEEEAKVTPALSERVEGAKGKAVLGKGGIVLSDSIAKNMNMKVGDEIVVVATNASGSVNGKSFIVEGIARTTMGPDGKSGYIHLEDAKELLRMEEILEIAVRIDNVKNVDKVTKKIEEISNKTLLNKEGKPAVEVHKWQDLTNFSSIVNMIDVMSIFLKTILIFIVMFSILNIMMMAVYERTGEIGTIAAIGTQPKDIKTIFIWEGIFLGFISSVMGSIIGVAINTLLSVLNISFKFAKSTIVLKPENSISEIGLIIVAIVVISIISSFFPASKAAKMEPVEALRH